MVIHSASEAQLLTQDTVSLQSVELSKQHTVVAQYNNYIHVCMHIILNTTAYHNSMDPQGQITTAQLYTYIAHENKHCQ